MAKKQIVVPDIGGAEGAEVIEVLVAVGDEVTAEQSLIVLESDKASMEIPSSGEGVVVELLTEVGKELAEGDPIVLLETSGADSEASEESVPETPEEKPESAPESAPEPAPEPAPQQAAEPAAESPAPQVDAEPVAERVASVPDIGTEDEVDLIEVCVAVGDVVAEGDSLVVLESDKASMEVPAPFAGEVINILVKEGDSVKLDDQLMVLKAEAAESKANPENKEAASTAAAIETTQSENAGDAATERRRPPRVSAPAQAQADASSSIYAGPAVRKMAREFGLDLSQVSGTGPRGRLLKEDLHQFVKGALDGSQPAVSGGAGIPAIPEVDFAAFGEVELESLSKIAKLTAANMQRSWLNVPHVTQFDDADITDLEAFRGEMKAEAQNRGVKLTPMPFILKACAVALRDNPKFCSSLSADGQSLVRKKYIHIGMAVDTPAGLLVPVIRDVDKKTLWELAAEVVELAGKARDRKLKPAEMQGGCFTISSLGNIGGRGFTPIVNAPEVGILGVSKAAMSPVWNGSEFESRKMLPLALSYDHRVINGGDGGRFLSQLVAMLGDIRKLLL